MLTVLILNVFVIFFAFLESRRVYKHGLKVSFFLIFIFLALRYDYGNDYSSYLNYFIEFNQYALDSINLFDDKEHMEVGWIFLCLMFSHVGFFSMMAVLAIFNCLIYYHFIKKYVPFEYYWFAVFLYVFNAGLMLTHLSAMRQSIAIALFVFAIEYIFKKDFIRYCFVIAVASLFHTSAILLLPVYLLGIVNWKLGKLSASFALLIFVSLFIFGNSLVSIFNSILSSVISIERYSDYNKGDVIKVSSGLGVIYSCYIFILLIYFDKLQSMRNSLLIKLSILSLLFLPLSLYIPSIGRFAMYFSVFSTVTYPIMISSAKHVMFRIICNGIIIFMTVYGFFVFFNSEIYKEKFSQYQTIFSAPQFY